jgi:hypothetical protein
MITATSIHIGSCVSIIQLAIAICSKRHIASKRRLNKPSTRAIKSSIFLLNVPSREGVPEAEGAAERRQPRKGLFVLPISLHAKERPEQRLTAAFDSSSRRASPVQPTPEKDRHIADYSA